MNKWCAVVSVAVLYLTLGIGIALVVTDQSGGSWVSGLALAFAVGLLLGRGSA
jgi:hypothetical protein